MPLAMSIWSISAKTTASSEWAYISVCSIPRQGITALGK